MGSMAVTLPVLMLEGSPRSRGRVHGEALRGLIHEYLDRWRADIAEDLGVDPAAYLRDLVAVNDFLPAARRWTPGLLEEVEGLAEGAGLDLETALVRQLADEDFWTRLGQKGAGRAMVPSPIAGGAIMARGRGAEVRGQRSEVGCKPLSTLLTLPTIPTL